MTESERERVILRRMTDDAPSSADVTDLIGQSPGIDVLRETAPSTVLVEGNAQSISDVVSTLAGWSASAVVKYQLPDPKPRILKPSVR